jgi:hypothetical protein
MGFHDMEAQMHDGVALDPLPSQPRSIAIDDAQCCAQCEVLKERLRQLSYCLAVAQRLTIPEAV